MNNRLPAALLLVVTAAFGVFPVPALSWTYDFRLYTGARTDDFKYNIAGDINGRDPDILSELEWSDLSSYQLGVGGEIVTPQALVLQGDAAYGWILDGQQRDSDYDGNGRSEEDSRSISESDGNTLDLNAGIGFKIKPRKEFSITPLVGYTYRELNVVDFNGTQLIPPSGPFAENGKNLTYDTTWQGPWLGFDSACQIRRHTLSFKFKYHWFGFEGLDNHILRNDLQHPVSFREESDGEGYDLSAGYSYALSPRWSFDLDFNFSDWRATEGVSKSFRANGTTGEVRFNEGRWESVSLMIAMRYHFDSLTDPFLPDAPLSGGASRVKMSGQYRLAGGYNGREVIWNDSNADLQERNFRFLFGERLNNTYDPAIYDRYLLNIDFSPKDKWDAYMQLVADPWSVVGTTGEQLVKNQDGTSTIRPNLKYSGAFNGVLNEIYRANTSDSVGVPMTEVQKGHTQAFRTRGFFDFGTIYDFKEYDIDYEFRPIRKLWVDYTEDDWHARFFALADQSQALSTDDPLELSNHKDYWQQSPWLYQYQPIQFFTDGSMKRGYYSDALSFLARDSDGNRLVLLRGASVEADMGSTYFASTIAAPFTPWDEKYFQADNTSGAFRLKHYVNDRLMIGGVYGFRAGYIDASLADINHILAVDTKIKISDKLTGVGEIATSYRDRDLMTNQRLVTNNDGRAYKVGLESAFDHRLHGHSEFEMTYTQMDRTFEPNLSRYSNTRDDHFWGKHLTFKEYTPDLEHFRLGDGVDVNRRVYRFRWKEQLFKKRFENLFDVRHVRSQRENTLKENVLREEMTYRATKKLTLKGMFRWQDLPKSVAGIEPFLSNFYFPSDTVDTTNLRLLNTAVPGGMDTSRFTYAGGAQYVFNKQWTTEGFLEVSNDLSDFPRGLLNDAFRDSNDVVDGLLIDRVQTFLYTQGPLGGVPPYEYHTVARERIYWRPDDRVTVTFHAAQNGYKFASGIDDNITHQGASVAFDYSKKAAFFFDYTHSMQIDLPLLISSGSSDYAGHHNVYFSADYHLNAATLFRAEYGVFGLGSDTPQVTPYSTTAFSLPTIDTEHLVRVSLTGEF